MALSSKDQRSIAEFSSIANGLSTPSNRRDASNPSSDHWKNARPTPIVTPAQREMRHGLTPYARLSSSRPPKTGNPTAQNTMFNFYKQQQETSSRASTSKHFAQRNPEGRAKKKQKLDKPVTNGGSTNPFRPQPPEIHFITDDEDIGEPMDRGPSPDPIDSFSEPVPGPSRRRDSYHSPARNSSERTASKLQGDGKLTAGLRAQLQNKKPKLARAPSIQEISSDDEDSIRSTSLFNEPVSGASSSKPLRPGASTPSHQTTFQPIQPKVDKFEQSNKIDLHQVQQARRIKSQASQTVKASMKPKLKINKPPSTPESKLDRDPIATSTTDFVKPAKKRQPIRLPLSGCAVGFRVVPDGLADVSSSRYALDWNEETADIALKDSVVETPLLCTRLSPGSIDVVTAVDMDAESLGPQPPLIKIRSSSTMQGKGRWWHELERGDARYGGDLVFRFMTDAPGWDQDAYTRLLRSLVKISPEKEYIVHSNPVWQATCTAAKQKAEIVKRKAANMDVDTPPSPASAPQLIPGPRHKLRSKVSKNSPQKGQSVRRSTRISGQEEQPETQASPVPDADELILVYPLTGPGALNITNADVGRLRPGEFLNDTIIEFGLKLWLNELRDTKPELADQIHVFSSFFYKKLSTKKPEDGYNSVRKWTSKIDIFQKKYIIVPINEHLHWYLAIISHPEYVLLPPDDAPTGPVRRSTRIHGIEPEDTRPPSPPSTVPTDSVRSSMVPDVDSCSRSRSASWVADSEADSAEAGNAQDVGDESVVENMISMTSQSESTQKPELTISTSTSETEGGGNISATGHTTVSPTFDNMELEYPSSPSVAAQSALPREGSAPVPIIIDDEEPEAPSTSISGIATTSFYGTAKPRDKGKQKAESFGSASASASGSASATANLDIEAIDLSAEEREKPPRTQIFTFDSLDSSHPQAVKRLANYLQMEAADKKGLDRDKTRPAEGKTVHVPSQPNFCDCGVYLLHFAHTFMNDPELSVKIINEQPSKKKGKGGPHEHWGGTSVGTFRDELTVRIRSLSDEWKRLRAEKEEQKKKESTEREASGEKATPVASASDSDSDIVMEEVEPDPKPPAKRKLIQRRGGP